MVPEDMYPTPHCYAEGAMDLEQFSETEPELELVYIAKRLKEALAIEEIFTREGIEYDVRTDTYRGGIIFVSERVGAFFYVPVSQLERAREVLQSHRYRPQAWH
jgi:hypothetical protein